MATASRAICNLTIIQKTMRWTCGAGVLEVRVV